MRFAGFAEFARFARFGFFAALALAAVSCAPRRPITTTPSILIVVPETLRVRVGGRIERVAIDPYAAAVALTELAPGAEPPDVAERVYHAQILVARTYAASRMGRHSAEGFDLCDATHCQRYEPDRLQRARWAQLARELAQRTSGHVLVHEGRLAEAVFHADCGGHSADAKDVWGSARPYLVARRDGDGNPHREWTSTLAHADLASALMKDRRTRFEGTGATLRDLRIASRDRSGRASRIRILPTQGPAVEVNSDVFRAVVSAALGIRALPSTRFEWKRRGDTWVVTGTGFGHGVGLCQAGALGRARKGRTAAEILSFYYPGAIIRTAGK